MPQVEVIAFFAWLAATFALSLAATLVIVHRALALPPKGELSTHLLLRWGVISGGSLLLLAVLAGVLVFRPTTPWNVVLTWPWLIGLTVGAGYFFGLAGHMDGGSKLCDAPQNGSCDNAWGLGAVLLSFVAAVVLGGVFVSVVALRRLLPRRRRTREQHNGAPFAAG